MRGRQPGPPGAVLEALAGELRGEGSVISGSVVSTGEAPALGLLTAAGPRASASPAEYAFLVEAVREGYLLHYGRGRVVVTDDRDLALLGGDYLYALGLERLARLGDLEAVRELADLISLAAQAQAGDRAPERARRECDALWLITAVAIAAGPAAGHAAAKAALRAGSPAAAAELWSAAGDSARAAGLDSGLAAAADAIDFRADPLS
jgi:hypothetical protein